MAEKLRKYQYDRSLDTRPNTAPTPSSTVTRSRATPPASSSPEKMDAVALKSELKNALADDFNVLKTEIQAVKLEIINNTAAIHSEMDKMKATIKDVEGGLSTWSDEVTTLQTVVSDLKTEMAGLKGKCEDMEGRMRRCNVRILGVAETEVRKLLRKREGVRFGILFPAQLRITHDSKENKLSLQRLESY